MFCACYEKPLSDDGQISEAQAIAIRAATKLDNNLKEDAKLTKEKRGSSFDAMYKKAMGAAASPAAAVDSSGTPWINVVRTATVSSCCDSFAYL
jgi:hypothetical protein